MVIIEGFEEILNDLVTANPDLSISNLCRLLIQEALIKLGLLKPPRGAVRLVVDNQLITGENNEESPKKRLSHFIYLHDLSKLSKISKIPEEELIKIQKGKIPDCHEISGLMRSGIDPNILKNLGVKINEKC